MRKYYVLAHWNVATSEWGVEFGDYDRSVVSWEREDYLQSGNYRAKFLHIVCCGDTQAAINAALAAHPAPKASMRG